MKCNEYNTVNINNALSSLALIGNNYHKQIDERLLFLSQDVRVRFCQTPSLKDTIITSFLSQLAIDYYERNGISVKLNRFVDADNDFINYVTELTSEGGYVPVMIRCDKSNNESEHSVYTEKHCLLIAGVNKGAFLVIKAAGLSFPGKNWKSYIGFDKFFSEWRKSGGLYYNIDYDAMKNHVVDSRLNESVIKRHSLGLFDVGNMADFVLNIPYCYTEQEIKTHIKDVCYKIEYSCIVPTRVLLNRSLERIESDYNYFVFSEDKYILEGLVNQWKNVARELLVFSEMPKTNCFREVANSLYNIAGQEKELYNSIHEKVGDLFQQ